MPDPRSLGDCAGLGAPDLLRPRNLGRPCADAGGANDPGAALRQVHCADRDDAAAADAAVAQRPARGTARPAPELAVQDRAHGRRRAERHDDRPRRDRFRPVHLPALRRRRQRQAHVRAARRVHGLRARPEDRRDAGRPGQRDAGTDRRGGRRAEGAAQAKARRHAGRTADRHCAAAARGDRAPTKDAARSDRRGAALARHDRRKPAEGSARAAAARPQRPARRDPGADGRGLARRAADRARPQDGLSAGRSRSLPGRNRGAAQARVRRRRAPARDPAADPRRPARRRPRRPVAARRRRRDRVQFRAQGGARPRPLDLHHAARRLRQDRLGRQDARGLRPGGADRLRARLLGCRRGRLGDDRRARFDAREGGPRATDSRRRQADRAERQLARAPAQQHDRRGAQGGRLRHPHRELPRQGEDPRPLQEGRHPAHLPRAAGELPQRADRARQDHVRPRHLREEAPAGRQDQLRQVRAAAQDRAARRHDPDQQRPRGRRPAPARLGAADPDRHARADGGEPARAAGGGRAPLRHGPVRGPHRFGQDDDAALGAQPHQRAGAKDLDRRGSGRDHPAGPAPGAGESQDRLDLRQGAARVHARRPGRDHARRDSRQ